MHPFPHPQANTTMYAVVDTHTGAQIGKLYSNAARARSQRDALDSRYGAVRYVVRPVETY